MKDETVIELLSLSQLARKCDVCPATIRRKIDAGLINIDAESGGAIFVRADRLEQIKALVNKPSLAQTVVA